MGFNTKNHHCKGGDCMCVGGELRVVRDGKLILEEGAVVEDPNGLLGGGADWNAAEGEPGHVLNRTHWVEETRVVIQENERQGAGPVYGAKEGYGNPTLDDGDGAIGLLSSAIVPGDTYIVTLNGVEYTGVAYEGGADIDGPGVHLFHSPEYGESWDTVEVPFSLNSYNGCMYLDGTGGFVKIEHVAKTTHPLPPALGGMPTLAADGSDAGKIVRVNARGDGYELVNLADIT